MNNCRTSLNMMTTKHQPNGVPVMALDNIISAFIGRDVNQFISRAEMGRSLPAVNILERPKDFLLSMEAAGYAKEDLKLTVENDVLTISAERRNHQLAVDEHFTRREFVHRPFNRSFRLPESVNADGISAEHRNGILTVRIPKAEEAEPRTKEISIA